MNSSSDPQQPGVLHLPTRRAGDAAFIVQGTFVGYAILVLLAILLFRFGGVMESGNDLNWGRSFFAAVNAATLTGFQQDIRINPQDAFGMGMVLALMLGGILCSFIVGGLAAVRILRLPYTDVSVVWSAFAATALLVLAGTIALYTPDRTLFQAVFLATSAFGNCGLFVGRLGMVDGWETHCVILPLALIGGLGLPVLIELFNNLFSYQKLSTHTKVVLTLTCLIYLCGAILLFAVLPAAGSQATYWRNDLIRASATALNAQSAGFPIESVSRLPVAVQWILPLLMLIGGSPAGTAGGLKTTALYAIARGTAAALQGRAPGRVFGIAMLWLPMLSGLIVVGFISLLSVVPDLDADRIFFLAVSSATGSGLSHDPVSITGPGLPLLATMMLGGKLLPLAVLWWMARTTPDADVAVG